ncbi:MAG TPA: flagellar basal body P-ring formation chaperone FlgA [Devosiaceae bacterium]|jgi:flagella basal body P-ring formation protein FlgA
MTNKLLKRLTVLAVSLCTMQAAMAAPALKSSITVASAIVTVGDMFDGAGLNAEAPLFRAPAPGTTGTVAVSDIRAAAARAGLGDFDAAGLLSVQVVRAGTPVDEALLDDLISKDLTTRGILTDGVTANTKLDMALPTLTADAVDEPVKLVTMHYMPGSGNFSARFTLSGIEQPLDISGHIELMIEAPHLVGNLASGTVLGAKDIELRRIPLKFAESSGYVTIDQLVGKALQHQTRAGAMLKANDVADPQVITRNAAVTVYYRSGPMTLTVKGQALNAASAGETVSVLNALTKKVIMGVAAADGSVQITAGPLSVAGL